MVDVAKGKFGHSGQGHALFEAFSFTQQRGRGPKSVCVLQGTEKSRNFGVVSGRSPAVS